MKNPKNHLTSTQKVELINFSKLETLRKRWNDKKLTTEKLKNYNKWSVDEKFKIVEVELRLEHYLCRNILVDLNGQDDLFAGKDKYFSSENLKNGRIDQITKTLEKKESKTIYSIKNLTFGNKVILWKSLKKSIFKNKFMGIDKKEHKKIITALDNVRSIRNGIAHLESKKQIYAKLRMLDANDKISKEDIYKKSIIMCRKIQKK